MRHLFAVLMLLASAPLFAQEDCDVFNIQELSAAYLNFSVDSTILQSDGSYEVYLSNGTTYTRFKVAQMRQLRTMTLLPTRTMAVATDYEGCMTARDTTTRTATALRI